MDAMMLFPGFLAAAPAGGGIPWPLFAVLGGVFLFIVILPARKEKKQKEAMIASLKKGDRVLMQSGMIGKISQVKDANVVVIEVDGAKIPFLKNTVASLYREGESSAADAKAK